MRILLQLKPWRSPNNAVSMNHAQVALADDVPAIVGATPAKLVNDSNRESTKNL